ncbi:MAG: hypothetical protein LBN94_00790 [Puniceicoccales bacterium]|jgi:hypothetical protein|nr:hypothetical protein [Puniceicoccales bacterium]
MEDIPPIDVNEIDQRNQDYPLSHGKELVPSIKSTLPDPTIEKEESQSSEVKSEHLSETGKIFQTTESNIDLVGQKIMKAFEILGKILGAILKGVAFVAKEILEAIEKLILQLFEVTKNILHSFTLLLKAAKETADEFQTFRKNFGII